MVGETDAVHAAQERELLRGRPYEMVRALRSALGELWGDKAGLFGLVVVVVFVIVAVAAPLLAPSDPSAQSLADRFVPPFHSWHYPLGTDTLGRDMLSRLIYGSRVSLEAGLGVVAIAGTVGTLLGLLSGYAGGKIDTLIMRAVDVQVAFPGLLLALIILSVVSPGLKSLIFVLAINGWMVYARITRGIVLSAKELPYVEAAILVGCRPRRVVLRHILPNLASPLLTLGVLEFARIVLAEAALSFLGLGIQPPQVSWGLMTAEGHDYLFAAWWASTLPGIAISIVVLGVNLFASWLRVAADPQQREKRFAQTSAEARGVGVV